MLEYEDDLTINPFEDRMTFTMPENLVDWKTIDEFSDADPSSKEYRRMMKKLGITDRSRKVNRRMRNDQGWD